MNKTDEMLPGEEGCCETASNNADAPCSSVSAEERHKRVAVAAYHRAECRNFESGCEQEDWFAAEAEIEQQLKPAA